MFTPQKDEAKEMSQGGKSHSNSDHEKGGI